MLNGLVRGATRGVLQGGPKEGASSTHIHVGHS